MVKESNEPEFRAWLKRYMTRLTVLSAIAIPIGFLFIKRPETTIIVSGLGAIGTILGVFRLSSMRD